MICAELSKLLFKLLKIMTFNVAAGSAKFQGG